LNGLAATVSKWESAETRLSAGSCLDLLSLLAFVSDLDAGFLEVLYLGSNPQSHVLPLVQTNHCQFEEHCLQPVPLQIPLF
jgi:hypothetical protein